MNTLNNLNENLTNQYLVKQEDSHATHTFSNNLPHPLTFNSVDNVWAMRIIENRIEVNEHMQVTDAAKAVLDAIQAYLRENIYSKKYEPYTTRITINEPGEYEACVDYTASVPCVTWQKL